MSWHPNRANESKSEKWRNFFGDDIVLLLPLLLLLMMLRTIFALHSHLEVHFMSAWRIYSLVYHLHIVSHKSSVNFACSKLFRYVCKVAVGFFGGAYERFFPKYMCTMYIVCTFSWKPGTFIISAVNMSKLTMSLLLLAFCIRAVVREIPRHSSLSLSFSLTLSLVTHPLICNSTTDARFVVYIYKYVCTENTENLFLSCSFSYTIARCFSLYQTMLLLSAFPNLILFIQKTTQLLFTASFFACVFVCVCMCVCVQCEPNELRLCVEWRRKRKKTVERTEKNVHGIHGIQMYAYIFICCE